MEEKTLLKLSIIVSILGISALYLVLETSQPADTMLSRLDQKMDQNVLISGMVLDINSLDEVTFIRLQKDETVSVTLFGDAPFLNTGDYVQIKGVVTENKEGEPEVIGDEIRVI